MKKRIFSAIGALALGLGTVFYANAQGNACGCTEDCAVWCESEPNYNCIITYTSGHELTCPQMGKKEQTPN